MCKRVLLLVLVFALAVAASGFGEAMVRETGLPEVSPGEWVITFLLAGARPIAVAVFWIKASQLREEYDFASLMPMYKTIVKLEPRFPPAWDFATYDFCVSIALLERNPKKRFLWVKKGLLEFGYEGAEKNPLSGVIPSTISFLFLKYHLHHPDIAEAIEKDKDLNPKGLSILELALEWGERATSVENHPVIADYVLESVYTAFADGTDSVEEKLRWFRKAIGFWERLKRLRPDRVPIAERSIKRLEERISELERRR